MLALCSCFLLKAGAEDATLQTAEDYYLQGKEFLLKGEYDKANEAFKKSQALLDDLNKGSGQEAKRFFSEEKKSVPEAGVIRISAKPKKEDFLQKAQQAYLDNDLDKALKFYRQALKLDPKNYNIQYNIAVIYLVKEEYKKAAEEFEKVIARKRRDAEAYYNLGVLYESFLGDSDRALFYYKKYLRYSRNKKEKELVETWVKYLQSQKIIK